MRANENGSIFEDSFEATKSTAFRSFNLLDEFDNEHADKGGYAYHDVVAPIIAANTTTATTEDGSAKFSIASEQDPTEAADLTTRVAEDYSTCSRCFTLNSTAYPPTSSPTPSATSTARKPVLGMTSPQPRSTFSRGMTGQKGMACANSPARFTSPTAPVSQEAVTGFSMYGFNRADVLTELYSNFSYGVNRAVLHGKERLH